MNKSLSLNKNHLMTELDIVRFLNPGVQDDLLNCSLEKSGNIFNNPAFMLNWRNINKKTTPVNSRYMREKLAKTPKALSQSSSVVDLTFSSDSDSSKPALFKTAKQSSSKSSGKVDLVDLTLSSDSEDSDSFEMH